MSEKDRWPLRKVVGYQENEYGVTVEVLECGHTMIAKDFPVDVTKLPRNRRRCRLCGKNSKS
jgi:hypothetical protein